MIVIKISKTGIIGNSKPCTNCKNFIFNNFDNLNLVNVLFSTKESKLVSINKLNLLNDSFTISKGYKRKKGEEWKLKYF